MKNYKKKIGFTFALSLICLPNGFASSSSNDNYGSGSTSSSDSFDSRPGFLGSGTDSHANDPKAFDSHNGANDNRSNSQTNTTSTPSTPPSPPIAPRRPQDVTK